MLWINHSNRPNLNLWNYSSSFSLRLVEFTQKIWTTIPPLRVLLMGHRPLRWMLNALVDLNRLSDEYACVIYFIPSLKYSTFLGYVENSRFLFIMLIIFFFFFLTQNLTRVLFNITSNSQLRIFLLKGNIPYLS